mmetsp:Transcript_89783/g.199502  ORF Transcript_89783/g.199502 Transcript_89783/m.199502 type:complete len:113 (-) Transcript_89783:213-551(-)
MFRHLRMMEVSSLVDCGECSLRLLANNCNILAFACGIWICLRKPLAHGVPDLCRNLEVLNILQNYFQGVQHGFESATRHMTNQLSLSFVAGKSLAHVLLAIGHCLPHQTRQP